jgi:hypothetical protein
MTNDPVLQWQPIATAPHDEQILVFSARWGAMMATFRSDFKTWFSRMQCPASLNDADIEAITHWMPLPLPLPQAPDIAPRQPTARPATGLPPSLSRFLDRASTREAV